MTKQITLYFIDANTSEIAVSFDGIQRHLTGIVVRQEQDGTKAWHKATGKSIKLPKNRYPLGLESDWTALAHDLDALGLLGHKYRVVNSFSSASWGEHRSVDLQSCYRDSFELGEFLTDAQAIEACESAQFADDTAAEEALKEAGFDSDLGTDGACYVAHLFREEADGSETQVEQ